MGTDIRLGLAAFTHPKILRLHRELGAEGALSLIRLWCWAGEHRPSGTLSGMTSADIEMAADWRGKPESFTDMCFELHLLDGSAPSVALHGWRERQTWAAGFSMRSRAARSNATKRWKKSQAHADSNANGNANAHAAAMLPSSPFPSSPFPSLPLPSKPLPSKEKEQQHLPFETQAFREAWSGWEAHRKDSKRPLTNSTKALQLKKLAKMGEARAIACLEHSTTNGWQGLFEPKAGEAADADPLFVNGKHFPTTADADCERLWLQWKEEEKRHAADNPA